MSNEKIQEVYAAVEAGKAKKVPAAVQEALDALRGQLEPGTAMLLKASHAMEFGRLVEKLQADYD